MAKKARPQSIAAAKSAMKSFIDVTEAITGALGTAKTHVAIRC